MTVRMIVDKREGRGVARRPRQLGWGWRVLSEMVAVSVATAVAAVTGKRVAFTGLWSNSWRSQYV
jgi:hypothetical protein